MKDFFGRIKRIIENRPGKIRRLLELGVQLEKVKAELTPAVATAETERKHMQDILDGVYLCSAQKELSRAIEPIKSEMSALTIELRDNPPELVEFFIEECRQAQSKIRDLLNTKPDVRVQDRMGEWLDQVQVDRGSALAAIDVLHDKIRQANELCFEDLSTAELRTRIEKIRSVPLPKIERTQFKRETPFSKVEESQVA